MMNQRCGGEKRTTSAQACKENASTHTHWSLWTSALHLIMFCVIDSLSDWWGASSFREKLCFILAALTSISNRSHSPRRAVCVHADVCVHPEVCACVCVWVGRDHFSSVTDLMFASNKQTNSQVKGSAHRLQLPCREELPFFLKRLHLHLQ